MTFVALVSYSSSFRTGLRKTLWNVPVLLEAGSIATSAESALPLQCMEMRLLYRDFQVNVDSVLEPYGCQRMY
jgi:hypothetical protein